MRPFPTSDPPPIGSILVCRICKEPSKCIAPYVAKIFYVHGDGTTQCACIHLGFHRYRVKAGNCRSNRKRIDALIQEHVEKTPQASHSKIILEASKDLFRDYLLRDETNPPRLLSLEELEPVFDSCKELNSLSLRNWVTSFKYLQRFGIMDGITKLRGLSNWAYVQRSIFPSQGDDSDKVFVFKMSEVQVGSGVHLVKRMQPGGNLENAWIMSDHVKRE